MLKHYPSIDFSNLSLEDSVSSSEFGAFDAEGDGKVMSLVP